MKISSVNFKRISIICAFSSLCCGIILYIFQYGFLFCKGFCGPEWAKNLDYGLTWTLLIPSLIPAIWFPKNKVEFGYIVSGVFIFSPLPVIIHYFIKLITDIDFNGSYLNSLINAAFNYIFMMILALLVPVFIVTSTRMLWLFFTMRKFWFSKLQDFLDKLEGH